MAPSFIMPLPACAWCVLPQPGERKHQNGDMLILSFLRPWPHTADLLQDSNHGNILKFCFIFLEYFSLYLVDPKTFGKDDPIIFHTTFMGLGLVVQELGRTGTYKEVWRGMNWAWKNWESDDGNSIAQDVSHILNLNEGFLAMELLENIESHRCWKGGGGREEKGHGEKLQGKERQGKVWGNRKREEMWRREQKERKWSEENWNLVGNQPPRRQKGHTGLTSRQEEARCKQFPGVEFLSFCWLVGWLVWGTL